MSALTGPQMRAMNVLASRPYGYRWSAEGFADKMWPNKYHARINAGGRMLTRLHGMGLVRMHRHVGYTLWSLSREAIEKYSKIVPISDVSETGDQQ